MKVPLAENLLGRVRFVVLGCRFRRDFESGLEVDGVGYIHHHIEPFGFGQFLNDFIHTLGTAAEDVLAFAVHFALEVFGEALEFTLFALALHVQFLFRLGGEFAGHGLELALDGLQFPLESFRFVLPWLELGFQVFLRLLNLSRVEHRFLQIDNGHLHLRRSRGGASQQNCRQNKTDRTNTEHLTDLS